MTLEPPPSKWSPPLPFGEGFVLVRDRPWAMALTDATGAWLWATVARAADVTGAVRLVAAELGLTDDAALRMVEASLAGWHAAGLVGVVERDLVALPTRPDRTWRLDVLVAMPEIAIRVRCDDYSLAELLSAVLAPAIVAPADFGATVDILRNGDGYVLVDDTLPAERVADRGLARSAVLARIVFRSLPPERLGLMLHAAALVSPAGEAVLLTAPSGSGKSTLAAELHAAGWAMLADDIVAIDAATLTVQPTPFATALKGRSRALLTGRIQPLEQRAALRAANHDTEFFALVAPGTAAARLGRIVMPRWEQGAEPRLEPLGPLEMLKRLQQEGALLAINAGEAKVILPALEEICCASCIYGSADDALALLARWASA